VKYQLRTVAPREAGLEAVSGKKSERGVQNRTFAACPENQGSYALMEVAFITELIVLSQ